MKTGRPPKPTALKELAGNPGKRPLNHNEPKPQVIAIECPEWITGEGRKEYERLATLLVTLRVLTEADAAGLAAYVYEYDAWVRAERLIRKEGSVLTGEKGGKYMNPRVGIANMHFKNMLKLMMEFGLTPASRSRIEAQPEDEKQTSLAEKLFAGVSLE
jgi:P27 family predicted phage terminase small subunit